MANSINISFKVAGGELSTYMNNFSKQSEKITNDAIKSAVLQSNSAKEQLAIINQTIAALEKKNRIEDLAKRNIALTQRDTALSQNKALFEGRKNAIFSDTKLSELQKKERVIGITAVEQESNQKIKDEYKDTLTVLREENRQNKILTSLSREQILTAKEAAREQVRAIINGDKTLADVYKQVQNNPSEEEKLTIRLIEKQLEEEKKKKDKESGGKSILGSLLAADNLNKIISSAGQLSQTQNGFDMIQPASNMAGRIIGGVLGGLVGSLVGGVGAVAGAGTGASIGGGLGDTYGGLKQRMATQRQEFLKSINRYRGITGIDLDESQIDNLSSVGVDYTQYMQMRSEYARRRGYANGSDKTTKDAIYLEKGLGVDQGTSASMIEIQRSFKESNRDLSHLVGGILEKGQSTIFKNDNTFLNEFLGRYSSLTKELLKTNATISTGIPMDILKQFNSIGGMFDARDTRSQGIITSINSALANPSSDNNRAIAYRMLGRQYPNKGIFDMDEEIGKGLGSPTYLKSVLGFIDQAGGDDQVKMKSLAGFLKGVPLPAIRQIFQHRNSLRNYDQKELSSFLPDDVLKDKAEKNTSKIEVNTATINNAMLTDTAVSSIKDALSSALEDALAGAVIEMKNGQGTINLKGGVSQAKVMENATKSPLTTSGIIDEDSKNVNAGIPGYLH